jgi:hypothetical protein
LYFILSRRDNKNKVEIISTNETFRGKSYGEWIKSYMHWVMGESPDVYSRDNILYLRGSARGQIYRGSTDVPINSATSLNDPSVILMKTGPYGYTISKDTAVMFSPLFSFFASNLGYKGKDLGSIDDVHNAAASEMDNSPVMFVNIYDESDRMQKLELFEGENDLKSHMVESPAFDLFVPENSLLADKFDVPLTRGQEYYNVIVIGAFLILRFTTPGKYQIDFGGVGDNSYSTRSVYDIEVKGENFSRLTDVSKIVKKLGSKSFLDPPNP